MLVKKSGKNGGNMEKIKRLIAVNDMSSIGRCSLTVIIPVLSAMGVQVCPVVTALYSTHTGFKAPAKADMTKFIPEVTKHWSSIGATFDAVYSGYLGSEEQIGMTEELIDRFPCGIVLVDPVMGDNGKAYSAFSPEMCGNMSRLCRKANVITPNLTEAAILLGEDYSAAPSEEHGMTKWLERLSEGKRSVVITGLELCEGTLGCGCYDAEKNRVSFIYNERFGGYFPGTGDIFSSVLLGGLMKGKLLADSVKQAAEFVGLCVKTTAEVGSVPMEGVLLEGLLYRLIEI